MKSFDLLHISLSLFEGEGGGTAAAGDSAAPSGETAEAPAEQTAKKSGRPNRKTSGEYANVRFGKQTADAEGSTDANQQTDAAPAKSVEERRAEYQKLINSPEYKEFYTSDTQDMINRRFRERSESEKKLSDTQPIMDLLGERYKVEDGDPTKILNALKNDSSYYQQTADENGMTEQQAREFEELMLQNRALRRTQEQQEAAVREQQMIAKFSEENNQMMQKYPGFDLRSELQNQRFRNLINGGASLEEAYTGLHYVELQKQAINATQKATEKKVADNVRSQGRRPLENGTASQNAFTYKNDLSALNKKDRAEMRKRMAQGTLKWDSNGDLIDVL